MNESTDAGPNQSRIVRLKKNDLILFNELGFDHAKPLLADLLVLLLSLLEGILEEVGVYELLAKIFFVLYSECQLTLAVGKTDGQRSRLRLTLTDICGCIPDPATVTADIGVQLHVRDN